MVTNQIYRNFDIKFLFKFIVNEKTRGDDGKEKLLYATNYTNFSLLNNTEIILNS